MPSLRDAQLERGELSSIRGKVRTAAQEAAPQIALRLLQRGSGGRSIYKILVKRELSTMKYSFYRRFFATQEDLMSS